MYPSPAPRELIVVANPDVGLRVTDKGLASLSNTPVSSLSELLRSANVGLVPLFGVSEDLLEFRISNSGSHGWPAPRNWSRFYKMSAPDADLEGLAEQLRQDPAVQAVFLKPGAGLPFLSVGNEILAPPEPNAVTSDLKPLQIYLEEPKHGINAIQAWQRPGGGGKGIGIVDVEGAWNFNHEDLKENQGGVVGGTESSDLFWRNHGTAVIGILSGDRNNGQNFGIVGICPEATVLGVSIFGQPTSHLAGDSGVAAAIRQAADKLNKGDIMLLELQMPGPTRNFEVQKDENDQVGYIPVEWWPDNLLAIQYAIDKQIIVVEAAGNGSCNLSDPIFNVNPAPPYGPFPPDWRNPFAGNGVDSGAIIVGAGFPPDSISPSGPDRSRIDFSNFGERVDAQGWGAKVTTCGFGNLQGIDEDRWYTPNFGGTSAAAPIVAGALASVQGILLAAGKSLLTPEKARKVVRKTGSPQTGANAVAEPIGKRPNILAMLAELGL